jgi:hypothetical protein
VEAAIGDNEFFQKIIILHNCVNTLNNTPKNKEPKFATTTTLQILGYQK